jgi:hypothetical protein
MLSFVDQEALRAEIHTLTTSLHDSGTYKPYIFPKHALGYLLLWAYLLLIPPIPPGSSLYKPVSHLRYPLFGLIFYLSVKSLQECRSADAQLAYILGLFTALTCLMSAVFLVFEDTRGEVGRWVKRKERPVTNGEGEGQGECEGKAREGADEVFGMDTGTQINASSRRRTDRFQNNVPSSNGKPKTGIAAAYPTERISSSDQTSEYVFQRLPSTFLQRLDWTFDLMTNLRQLNWSYRPPHQVPLPPSTPLPTRSAFLRSTFILFILDYLLVDILKVLSLADPYFSLGPTPLSSSPFPFPAISRRLLCIGGIFFLARMTWVTPTLFAFVLGPRIVGRYADPALYPPHFSSLRLIADRGLAGFWGGTWHQLFRRYFESAGDFLGRILGPGWEKRTGKGRALRIVTAFTLSGVLHACGSYTTIPPSHPVGEAFLFFAIQPLAIIPHMAIADMIRRRGWRDRIPRPVRQAANAGCALAWLYVTSPLVMQDFSRNGLFLREPAPWSIVRGGKWCLGDTGPTWSGKGKWWERGLAL